MCKLPLVVSGSGPSVSTDLFEKHGTGGSGCSSSGSFGVLGELLLLLVS